MSDDNEADQGHEADDGHDDHHDEETGRVTSPMQEYSMGQVTTGFLVLLVGVAVAYLVPTFV